MSFQSYIEKKTKSNRKLVKQIKKIARFFGFNLEYWHRYASYKLIKNDINFLELANLDVLEISAGEYWRENFNFRSFDQMNFPNYDICEDIITDKKYDLIIADNVWEHLKYPYKATKNVLKIGKLAKYRRIMTGSPVTKNPLDVYSQLEFLSDQILRQNYWAFRSRYAIMRNVNFGPRSTQLVVGFQRIPELNTIVENYSYRVLKEDCLDLPDKVYEKRFVSLTPEQVKAYEEMRRFNMTELEGETMTSLSSLTALIRLHQISCGHIALDSGETKALKSNRMNELLNVLDEVEGKVIIWASYRFDLKHIEETLKNKFGEESTASYFGDTKDKDRQNIVERFQDKNSKLKYFVGNPSTGGYGLTLTAAHTVIYYSNTYDLEKRMQSEDRAHRIGQVNKVTYIDLISEGTVDEKIVQSLRSKIDIASAVMGEDVKQWLIEPVNKMRK